jgi:UDP-glucose:(heptosyl)LPS alpha-1,3-glucosyltransferase
LQIVQIVKNFGLSGGMEEYAFRLTEELSSAGLDVVVLCEKQHTDSPTGVKVRELGTSGKPHWVSHFRFSRKVDHWLDCNPSVRRLVHSHERQSSHQVSTFHTTPFNFAKKKKLIHRISLRHRLWEKLEKREICGPGVRAVVPVSSNLKGILESKYTEWSQTITSPIFPGVSFQSEHFALPQAPPAAGGVIGFIGREWKRKGLVTVIEVWRELKKRRPRLKLRIAGVHPDEIAHLVDQSTPDVEILGWIKEKALFYQGTDLLFHPASKEAFGMIIPEAMSVGVPILCSSECGASELVDSQRGLHLPAVADTQSWLLAAEQLLEKPFPFKRFSRTWAQVAHEYLVLYQKKI